METCLKKLECRFLFESITIESAAFSYKTALSNGRTNTMGSTKLTYQKGLGFYQ